MIISLHFQKANMNFSWSYPTEHIQMGVLCLKWDMLKQNSLLLPVTCYCMVRNADVPPLCLRSAFVLPSFCLRYGSVHETIGWTDLQRTYNGPRTDLHRRELKVLTRLNKQKQVPYLTNLLPRERLAYANILFGNLRAQAQFLFGAKSRPVTSNR